MGASIIQSNILAQSADCLVNAAGTTLVMGSGVACALREAANGPVNEAATTSGPLPLGGVAVVQDSDLSAHRVIHVGAMPHYGDGRSTKHSIRAAVRNTLEKAETLGCRSLAIPPLGCGVAGFDLPTGVRRILE